jgi:hypothetical protein
MRRSRRKNANIARAIIYPHACPDHARHDASVFSSQSTAERGERGRASALHKPRKNVITLERRRRCVRNEMPWHQEYSDPSLPSICISRRSMKEFEQGNYQFSPRISYVASTPCYRQRTEADGSGASHSTMDSKGGAQLPTATDMCLKAGEASYGPTLWHRDGSVMGHTRQ